jgi:hypothetical protein
LFFCQCGNWPKATTYGTPENTRKRVLGVTPGWGLWSTLLIPYKSLSLLLKGETMIDCMSTSIGHAKCHDLCSVSFGLALRGSSDRMNGYSTWIVPLIPDHRLYQLTNQMKWWCIMTKSFQFSPLSLSAKIKPLSTGSSQFSLLFCSISAKIQI